MRTFISSREHVAKLQRYEARKKIALHYFDRLLALCWILTGLAVVYIILVGMTV